MADKQRILITGASGFIGSFLCEEALRRGFDTWAAVRRTSSRKWLKLDGLQFVELDMTNPDVLRSQLSEHEGWDVVVHAAGATKCLNKAEFDFHNFECTKNLVEALAALGKLPRQMLYMSSLSAIYGSAYGESKLKTEGWLTDFFNKENTSSLVIFRPTGVYGPREKDYFMMVKSIKQHMDFEAGLEPQKLTFVYVRDVVGAVFASIEHNVEGGIFNLTDGQVYSSRDFSRLIQNELGVKWVFRLKAPLWFLRFISCLSEDISHITKKPSTLNRDKYKIMAQRDWTCDISPMVEVLHYTPQWQLERGVKEAIEWYKKENWI